MYLNISELMYIIKKEKTFVMDKTVVRKKAICHREQDKSYVFSGKDYVLSYCRCR